MPKVSINITAQDDASTVLRKVSGELKGLDTTTQKTGSSLSTLSKFLIGGTITSGIYAIGSAILKASAEMEQNRVAFTTMLGSAEKANLILRDMTTFAQQTPFELPQIVNAGKQMLAFGFTAKEIIPTLTKLGDVASGLNIPLNDLTAIYGKIKTSNRIMGDDLLQLGGRGIPIVGELAKVFNTSKENISKMASEGKIKFADLEKVMTNLTKEGSIFGGLMDKQSQTLGGKWSNFNDSLGKSAVIIGDAVAPMAKDLLDVMTQLAGKFTAGIGNPKSITMTGSIIKDINESLNGTSELMDKITNSMGSDYENKMIDDISNMEENMGGVSGKFDEYLEKYGKLNGSAILHREYTRGNVELTDDQVASMEKILAKGRDRSTQTVKVLQDAMKYEQYLNHQILLTDKEANSLRDAYSVMQSMSTSDFLAMPMNNLKKMGEEFLLATAKAKKAEEDKKKGDEQKWVASQKYYDDLIQKNDEYYANDMEKIQLKMDKELEAYEKQKGYLSPEQRAVAKDVIESTGEFERNKQLIADKAKMFEAMGQLQANFYTQSASAEANAVGQMSASLVENFKKLGSDVSGVLNDVAKDTKKTGLTMGDSFKIGASVAVTALNSISAVMQMQQQMAQAQFQRKISDLQTAQDAERRAIEERYQMEADAKAEKDALSEEELSSQDAKRIADLEAYKASLVGQTDAEIETALEKKDIAIRASNDQKNAQAKRAKEEKEIEKKKAEELKAIDQKFAMEKWKTEVEAFKSKQEYDKAAIIMATAVGVINAWASAMASSWVLAPIVGATLSALMIGTAGIQLSMVNSQKPPAPPAFATGITNFEGGTAIVGERGRELVNLPKGSNVITNENTERLLGGGSPSYIVNNIYVNGVMTQQDIVDLRQASAYGGY